MGYKFADSILSLAENPDAFQGNHHPIMSRFISHHADRHLFLPPSRPIDYDWVLRTDLDTFLTKAFATYTPASCSLLCGGGGYSSDWNMKKLSAFARAKGISNYNESLSNIGSTWYGPGKVVAKVRLHCSALLATTLFSPSVNGSSLYASWRNELCIGCESLLRRSSLPK